MLLLNVKIYTYMYIDKFPFFSNKTPYLHANSIIYLLFVDFFVKKKKKHLMNNKVI